MKNANDKLFKPLIATSLALSLSSMAMAQAQDNSATSTPIITMVLDPAASSSSSSGGGTGGSTTDKSAEFKIKWQEIGGSSSIYSPSPLSSNPTSKIYSPTSTGTTGASGTRDTPTTPFNKLTFEFKNDQDTSTSSTCDSSTSECTVSVPGKKNNTLTVDMKGNGLQMGADGKGTLEVNTGGNQHDKKLVFHLKAGGGEDTLAFKGNIVGIIGGGGATEPTSASFKADFNGNVEGNITLKLKNQKNPFGTTNTLNFKGNKGMIGTLTLGQAQNHVTFEKAGLQGDLIMFLPPDAHGTNVSNDYHSDITFKAEDAYVKGNIVTASKALVATPITSKITFEKGGSITGDIVTWTNTAHNATTILTFGKAVNQASGGRTGTSGGSGGESVEAVADSGSNTNLTASITGNIITGHSALTKADFYTQTSTINGKLLTDDGSKLEMQFIGNAKNSQDAQTLSSSSSDNKAILHGDIITQKNSVAQITFKTQENTINGNLTTLRGGSVASALVINVEDNAGGASASGGGSARAGDQAISPITTTINGNIKTQGSTLNLFAKNSTLKIIGGDIQTAGGNTSDNVIQAKKLQVDVGSISLNGNANTEHRNVLVGGAGSHIHIKGGIWNNTFNNGSDGKRNYINIKLSGNKIKHTSTLNAEEQTTLSANIHNKGYTNIVLENATWTSYDPNDRRTGMLTNYSGETNLVLRNTFEGAGTDSTDSVLALNYPKSSHFINSLGGTTNIVLEKRLFESFDVSYTKGEVNLIFASSSTGSETDFIKSNQEDMKAGTNSKHKVQVYHAQQASELKTAVDINSNKILGKTYQDGIKLTLKDMQVKVGNETLSLLGTFGDRFNTSYAPLRVESKLTKEGHLGSITGLAVGSLTSLASSATAGVGVPGVGVPGVGVPGVGVPGVGVPGVVSSDPFNNKNYIFTINERSAFVGSIDLKSEDVSLKMKKDSKLIIEGGSNHLKILNLELDAGISFDEHQSLKHIFDQSNTIINLATGVNDIYNVTSRTDFRLLEIGKASSGANGANAVAVVADGAQSSSGLITHNGLDAKRGMLFQVYVNNTNSSATSTLGKDNIAKASTAGTAGTDSNKYGTKISSDRIIIHDVNQTPSTQNLQIIYDANTDLNSISYQQGKGTETSGNIALVTVINHPKTSTTAVPPAPPAPAAMLAQASIIGGATPTAIDSSSPVSGQVSTTAGVSLNVLDTLLGFDVISSSIQGVYTDQYGQVKGDTSTASGGGDQAQAVAGNGEKNDYTTYFLTGARNAGVARAYQESTSTALSTNYDLFIANFNSLSKRMGELRNNPYTQGAWIRLFNGSQSNEFSLSKSYYTTLQGGYDYAFKLPNANNYTGIALSYVNSSSKLNKQAIANMSQLGASTHIEQIQSNGVELGFYNAYVEETGIYNDTIAKVGYILTGFNQQGEKYNTQNLSFTLSNEVGYKFVLGEDQTWSLTPQLELGIGYLDRSSYKQVQGNFALSAIASDLLNFRTRVGSAVGYDFKNLTLNQPIKANLYAGLFYEFDYVKGGSIKLQSTRTTEIQSKIENDQRLVLNLGTYLEIKDQTRLYFDFEKSFIGKITTDYQVNLGVRYSFGEKVTLIPTTKTELPPLELKKEETQRANQAEKQGEEKGEEKKN